MLGVAILATFYTVVDGAKCTGLFPVNWSSSGSCFEKEGYYKALETTCNVDTCKPCLPLLDEPNALQTACTDTAQTIWSGCKEGSYLSRYLKMWLSTLGDTSITDVMVYRCTPCTIAAANEYTITPCVTGSWVANPANLQQPTSYEDGRDTVVKLCTNASEGQRIVTPCSAYADAVLECTTGYWASGASCVKCSTPDVGTQVKTPCSAYADAVLECAQSYFSSGTTCQKCSSPGDGAKIKTPCTANADALMECVENYFKDSSNNTCVPCSVPSSPAQQVAKPCTSDSDTTFVKSTDIFKSSGLIVSIPFPLILVALLGLMYIHV
jgi:hypothetical protein